VADLRYNGIVRLRGLDAKATALSTALDELRAAAVDPSASQQARDAARFLLDHPPALERLATYGEPAVKPPITPLASSIVQPEPPPAPPDTTSFTADNVRDMVDDYRQLLGLPPLPPPSPTLPPPGPQDLIGQSFTDRGVAVPS